MKFIIALCVAFILLLVFGLCKISGEYDDELEKQLKETHKEG